MDKRAETVRLVPTSRLKLGVKELLLTSKLVQEFVARQGDKIQTARFSEVAVNDIPLIVILVPEETSTSVSDAPIGDRTRVKLIVEALCFADNTTKVDDISYEIREIIATNSWKKNIGKEFNPIRHVKTETVTDTVGQKLVAVSTIEFSTFYDVVYTLPDNSELFEGVTRHDSAERNQAR